MTSHHDIPARQEFALKVFECLREKFIRVNEKTMFSIYQTFHTDPEELIKKPESKAEWDVLHAKENSHLTNKKYGKLDGAKLFYSIHYLNGILVFYKAFRELTLKLRDYCKREKYNQQLIDCSFLIDDLYKQLKSADDLIDTVGSTSTGVGATRTFSLLDGNLIIKNMMQEMNDVTKMAEDIKKVNWLKLTETSSQEDQAQEEAIVEMSTASEAELI